MQWWQRETFGIQGALLAAVTTVSLGALLSCGEPPTPINPGTTSSQILDDDDYENPPVTPTPIPDPTPTATPAAPTPTWDWNVEGVIDSLSPVNPPVPSLVISYYDQSQFDGNEIPVDPEVYTFRQTIAAPDGLPVSFNTTLNETFVYVAEAWLDLNQNGQRDSDDLLGRSASVRPSKPPAQANITLDKLGP